MNTTNQHRLPQQTNRQKQKSAVVSERLLSEQHNSALLCAHAFFSSARLKAAFGHCQRPPSRVPRAKRAGLEKAVVDNGQMPSVELSTKLSKKHVVHNPKFSIFIARVHESEDTDNYQAVLDLVAGK